MSQFARFVFCLVAVSCSVNAEESAPGSFEEFSVAREECKTKFQITQDDLEAIVMTGDVFKINPCYWGCFYKKLGFLNDKGELDLDNFMTITRNYIKDDDYMAVIEKMGKGCVSVKVNAVTEGEAGCERGALLAAGFWESFEHLRLQLKDEQLSNN